MLRINEPDISKKEFEAVKRMAKDRFNEGFLLIGLIAYISSCVLYTSITGESITFAAATLVVASGLFFGLYILGEFELIYPGRFKILYKRKKH